MTPVTEIPYPALRRRLRLVRLRLAARAAARALRLGRDGGDQLLAVFVSAAVVSLALLGGLAAAGVPPVVGLPVFVAAFVTVLAFGVVLLGGPPEAELRAERDELTAALPEARRLWEEERARVRAEREAQAAAARAAVPAQPTGPPAAPPAAAHPGPDVVDLVPVVPPPNDWLRGDGSFPLAAVGESYHQRVLDELRGDLPPGQELVVPAVLRLEDHPHDRYAVSVLVGGRKVGSLARADAKAFRLRVAGEGRVGPEFPCRAAVRGGGAEPVTVRLDVCLYR